MPKTSGLELLEAEMARQHDDALASIASNGEMAERIAGSIRRNGRLLLIGMGASHYANRIAETAFRRLGIDAWAITAAELLQWEAEVRQSSLPLVGRDRGWGSFHRTVSHAVAYPPFELGALQPPPPPDEESVDTPTLGPSPQGGGKTGAPPFEVGGASPGGQSPPPTDGGTPTLGPSPPFDKLRAGGRPTIILVSQSGESGEIVELLGQAGEDWFGLTLDPDSTLGRAVPCLVGAGGGEIAFAATRSLVVTLALHATVLAALGGSDAEDGLGPPALPSTADALATLGAKTSIVVAGGGALRGLAEANALMLMELARMPALGFEHGQFRHGPLELLSPDVGVLLLRGQGAEGAAVPGLARAVLGAGSVPVIFDCSGEAPIAGAATVPFPPSRGIAAALLMLPALQRLIIGISGKKVERVGEPLRSTKITRAEP